MKSVKFYSATNCVELCYSGFYWLTGVDKLNEESNKLRVEARRICKDIGLHNEFSEYDVMIDFEERKMFVSLGGDRKTCDKIITEAKKRHFTFND